MDIIYNLDVQKSRRIKTYVTLHDSNGEEVMSQILTPIKADLAPGEDTTFRALFQNPPGLARRAGVDWSAEGTNAMPAEPARSS